MLDYNVYDVYTKIGNIANIKKTAMDDLSRYLLALRNGMPIDAATQGNVIDGVKTTEELEDLQKYMQEVLSDIELFCALAQKLNVSYIDKLNLNIAKHRLDSVVDWTVEAVQVAKEFYALIRNDIGAMPEELQSRFESIYVSRVSVTNNPLAEAATIAVNVGTSNHSDKAHEIVDKLKNHWIKLMQGSDTDKTNRENIRKFIILLTRLESYCAVQTAFSRETTIVLIGENWKSVDFDYPVRLCLPALFDKMSQVNLSDVEEMINSELGFTDNNSQGAISETMLDRLLKAFRVIDSIPYADAMERYNGLIKFCSIMDTVCTAQSILLDVDFMYIRNTLEQSKDTKSAAYFIDYAMNTVIGTNEVYKAKINCYTAPEFVNSANKFVANYI